MKRKRRSSYELDSKIRIVMEDFGKNGISIMEVSVKSGINWHTAKRILEKFEKLGLIENVFTHHRLKIYRWKGG